ncbi:MAG: hypothetical protein U0263_39770 [Polyangiaceae bacterium]
MRISAASASDSSSSAGWSCRTLAVSMIRAADSEDAAGGGGAGADLCWILSGIMFTPRRKRGTSSRSLAAI